MSGGILILGAGQAAAQLAISLRQGGHDGTIRMVGDEPYAPYQRPPLSKAFLKEKASIETLMLRRESYWADHKVDLDLGAVVGGSIWRESRSSCRTAQFTATTRWYSPRARARATCGCPASSSLAYFRSERSTTSCGFARRSMMRAGSPSSAVATSGSRSRRCFARRIAMPS
jgi:hypothetical protein